MRQKNQRNDNNYVIPNEEKVNQGIMFEYNFGYNLLIRKSLSKKEKEKKKNSPFSTYLKVGFGSSAIILGFAEIKIFKLNSFDPPVESSPPIGYFCRYSL